MPSPGHYQPAPRLYRSSCGLTRNARVDQSRPDLVEITSTASSSARSTRVGSRRRSVRRQLTASPNNALDPSMWSASAVIEDGLTCAFGDRGGEWPPQVSETLEQLSLLLRELRVREDASVVERGELRDLRDNIRLSCGRGRCPMLASLDPCPPADPVGTHRNVR